MPLAAIRFFTAWALALVVATLLVGCAGTFERLQGQDVRVQLLASQSSARFVQMTDEDRWRERADEVQRVIDDLRAYVDANAQATAAELIRYADQRIPWDRLTPADEVLIRDLYAVFKSDIQSLVARGELGEGDQLSIHGLLDAFERGLQPYRRR
ncbi:MAG: hypothetical protein JJU06_05850 [Ectothiorhodospiraceae bacterium]|nr:hypothetical protein [Ectothiorhodospiraceae bacterium]MCH8502901.1 hypothetical protein [Ectothiorhodospiraceae bacterium]